MAFGAKGGDQFGYLRDYVAFLRNLGERGEDGPFFVKQTDLNFVDDECGLLAIRETFDHAGFL